MPRNNLDFFENHLSFDKIGEIRDMESIPPIDEQQESTAQPPDKTGASDSGYKWRVMFSVIFGTFMFVLDSTAVNVAVPTLQKYFGTTGHPAGIDQVDGVLTAYILALGIITPLAGYLSDRFGIKRMYVLSLTMFTIGSILCSLAPSLTWLIIFRALQGLGGGMLGPLGISLLFGAFTEKERGLAFGIYGIPLVFAPASGPILGGYFVQYLDWRYIFWINVPIGILGIILGTLWLREQKRGTSARLDIPGVILATIGSASLLYAIQRGSSNGWTSALIISLLVVGTVSLIAFVIVELYTKDPLLDLRLFAKRTYAFASIVGWVSSIALFGSEFLVPIYLQSLRGQSPLQAGLLVLPLALAAGVATPLAGALYNRLGGRWLIAAGGLLLAINTWNFAHIALDTPFIYIMGLLVIRGVALGLVLQTTLTAALTGLRPMQLPRASSLLTATRTIFQSFGVAILGTIVTNQVTAYNTAAANDLKNPATALGHEFIVKMQQLATLIQQQQHVPAQIANQIAAKAAAGQILGPLFPVHFVQGINDAYYVTFALSLISAVLAFTLPAQVRQKPPVAPEDEQKTVPAESAIS